MKIRPNADASSSREGEFMAPLLHIIQRCEKNAASARWQGALDKIKSESERTQDPQRFEHFPAPYRVRKRFSRYNLLATLRNQIQRTTNSKTIRRHLGAATLTGFLVRQVKQAEAMNKWRHFEVSMKAQMRTQFLNPKSAFIRRRTNFSLKKTMDCLIATVFVMLLCGLSFSVSAFGSDLSADAADKVIKNAPLFVVQVNVKTVEGRERHGSGVLLECVGDNGYFATCYHVLDGSALSWIVNESQENVGDRQTATSTYFKDSARDVVMICLPLNEVGKKLVPLFPPSQPLEGKLIHSDNGQGNELLALGFPFYQRRVIYGSRVRLGKAGDASQFFSSEPRDLGYSVRPIQEDATAPGMSGGPVVDEAGRLAGLIVARLPDTVGFIIPSDVVVEDLNKAKMPGNLLTHNDSGFNAAWADRPYDAKLVERLQGGYDGLQNAQRWDFVNQWRDLFQETLGFREKFQEVFVDLTQLGRTVATNEAQGDNDRITLTVDPGSFTPGVPGLVRIWLNRSAHDFPASTNAQELDLAGLLQDGENLIVISRKSGGEVDGHPSRGPIRLNRLVETVPLEVTLHVGGRSYTIDRGLPALLESYSIYLTVRKSGVPKSRRHNAYVAVNLEKLAEVINQNPIRYKDPLRDANRKFSVEVALDPLPQQPFLAFQVVTPQSVKIKANARVSFSKLKIQYSGLTLTRDEPTDSIAKAEALVQMVVAPPSGEYRPICRFVSGGIDKFSIEVGQGFSLDLGALASEYFLVQLNDKFEGTAVESEKGRPLDSTMIRDLLSMVGLGIVPPDLQIDLKDVVLDKTGWAVFTLEVGKGKDGVELPLQTSLPEKFVETDETNAFAVLVTSQVPAEAVGQVLSGPLGLGEGALAAATAAGVSTSRIKILSHWAETPADPIRLKPGNLTEWATTMRGRFVKALHSECTFNASASSFNETLAKELEQSGFRVTEPAATGEIAGQVAQDGFTWNFKKLVCTAAALMRDKITMKSLVISAADFQVKGGVGKPLSGRTKGTLNITGLEWGHPNASASGLHANFEAFFDEATPGVVSLTLDKIQGTVNLHVSVVGREVPMSVGVSDGHANLKVENGAITGTADFGGPDAHLTLEFTKEGVRPKFDSKILDGISEKKVENELKKDAEKLRNILH